MDPLYDETTYLKFASKPTDQLEQIVEEISAEESKYLDLEARHDESLAEIEKLSKKQAKNPKPDREERIQELSDEVNSIRHELEVSRKDREELMQIRHIIEVYILGGQDLPSHRVTRTEYHTAQRLYPHQPYGISTQKVYLNQLKSLYIKNHLKRLATSLTPMELRNAESEILASSGKQQIKKIYEHYRNLALKRAPSTQALTAEEIEQEQGNPLEELAPTIQTFARAKLAENLARAKQSVVIPKPPKQVSTTGTNTAQTQTTIPLNSFKVIKKGDTEFLEPLTPQKAEELAIKKKLVQNVVMLDPNRYKRKMHVVRSSPL